MTGVQTCALPIWMQQFLLCQVQEDHLCDILNRENILGEEFLWDVFQETFLKAFHAIVKFFEAARKKGLIRKDVDPISATTMLFGSLNHVGRHQKIQQKVYRVSIAQEKYRAQVIEQFLNIIISGISGGNA